MPRVARVLPVGLCVHVVTRGNARATVFHAPAHYRAFVDLLVEAQRRAPLELLAWCLMPNHIHLVTRQNREGALARFMHWLLTTHVQRYRAARKLEGRVWQGRYKSFPIQADRHFVTVLRYVERNPVRAALAARSTDWAWSSARERVGISGAPRILTASPVELPSPWASWVDEPITGAEIERVRESVRRSRPFGDDSWVRDTVELHGLEWTMRPQGRNPSQILRKRGDRDRNLLNW